MNYNTIENVLGQIRKITDFEPKVGLILGSGLGDFAQSIEVETVIDYKAIKGFPVPTVLGHNGRLVLGTASGVKVGILQGRVHHYEGYSMDEVVLPVRILGLMGAETLIITNAAGGINPDFKKGGFMIIKDHISSFVPSPLRGANIDELGVRFPDMSSIYDAELREKARESAKEAEIDIKEGVYVQTPGPNYESCAEIQMYKILGADAVGMSTACEATAARHMGMKVCGISCITNLAAGISKTSLTHEEVQETSGEVSEQFRTLMMSLISKL